MTFNGEYPLSVSKSSSVLVHSTVIVIVTGLSPNPIFPWYVLSIFCSKVPVFTVTLLTSILGILSVTISPVIEFL